MASPAPARTISPASAPPAPITDRNVPEFRRALLGWYQVNQRDLPWRRTRDPYQIWVSEIMLQQTRVAAVLQHYKEFLQRFPSVQTLAAATEDQVLSAWSGLGYYRRARMLHRGAIEIVQNHDGRLPETYAGLLKLPGIGRYTAAAIASIAFSEAVAVVDGNVERVASRITGSGLNSKETQQWAQNLLAEKSPGNFNQSMMELGAIVCTPRSPDCSQCPVRKWCRTRGEHPRPVARAPQQKKELWCSLDERERANTTSRTANSSAIREIRLVQRAKTHSLMPGMWELPLSLEAPALHLAALPWRTFRHCITVTDYTVHVVREDKTSMKQSKQKSPVKSKGKWVATDQIGLMPVTGLTRKILKAGGII